MQNGKLANEIWICNSGAFGSYCHFMEGLCNVRKIHEEIDIGTEKSMAATKGEVRNDV